MFESILVGLGTGILSGMASWWMLSRMVRPRLRWRPTIAKYRFDDDRPGYARYQVRLENPSRRVAQDVTVTARIQIPGLVRASSTEGIELFSKSTPAVRPKGGVQWRIGIRDIPEERRRRWAQYIPEEWQKDFREGREIDLEAFMKHFPGSELRLAAFGSDAYTWARASDILDIDVGAVRIGSFLTDSAEHTGTFEDPR